MRTQPREERNNHHSPTTTTAATAQIEREQQAEYKGCVWYEGFIFLVYFKGLLALLVINGEITGKEEMDNHPLQKISISPMPHSSELKFQLKPVMGFPTRMGY
jgi:hypothetical protein